MWTIGEAASAIQARVLGESTGVLGPASNDARELERGGLFVALPGANEHGASFVAQAAEHGAGAMLVGPECPDELVDAGAKLLPVIVAPDVVPNGILRDPVFAPVGRLARAWRERCGFTVVGITGSTGKTSTKDLLASVLRGSRRVTASVANRNNEIGVPLTLLGAAPDTDVVICEMGMRALGEIEYLCGVADPDIGIVTGAGTAHIELLGSREAIVRAKAELVAGVREHGTAVVPADQPQLLAAAAREPDAVLTFGDGGDVWADDVIVDADGVHGVLVHEDERVPFALLVHGAHQARNLAAAACVVLTLDGSLAALTAVDWHEVALTSGRGDRTELAGGGVLIDDAYNANPESMASALNALVALPAERHMAVLGAMAELGDEHGPGLHHEVGVQAAQLGVAPLVVVASTKASREIARGYDETVAQGSAIVLDAAHATVDAVAAIMEPGDAVLIKASNSAGLHRLAAELSDRL